eukprot:3936939-Pleurochrysis_carterae.AAC.1
MTKLDEAHTALMEAASRHSRQRTEILAKMSRSQKGTMNESRAAGGGSDGVASPRELVADQARVDQPK